MAIKDKIKWDQKYKNTPYLLKKREASKKLVEALQYVEGKDVLEVACGTGRNSIYLAHLGYSIDAVDISSVALENLNKHALSNISTLEVDLEFFTPSENSYDLIVQTNFLDRDLIPKLLESLRVNGVIFIETYMEDEINEKSASNPNFLLKKDELKSFFDKNFQFLDYDEFENEPTDMYRMKKQSIIARKIS